MKNFEDLLFGTQKQVDAAAVYFTKRFEKYSTYTTDQVKEKASQHPNEDAIEAETKIKDLNAENLMNEICNTFHFIKNIPNILHPYFYTRVYDLRISTKAEIFSQTVISIIQNNALNHFTKKTITNPTKPNEIETTEPTISDLFKEKSLPKIKKEIEESFPSRFPSEKLSYFREIYKHAIQNLFIPFEQIKTTVEPNSKKEITQNLVINIGKFIQDMDWEVSNEQWGGGKKIKLNKEDGSNPIFKTLPTHVFWIYDACQEAIKRNKGKNIEQQEWESTFKQIAAIGSKAKHSSSGWFFGANKRDRTTAEFYDALHKNMQASDTLKPKKASNT